MGFYIQRTARGEALGANDKARLLLQDEGARKVEGEEWEPNLICVVDNGGFQAAAFCYNRREFQDFRIPQDLRPKYWIVHPRAAELCGITKNPYCKLQPDGQWSLT